MTVLKLAGSAGQGRGAAATGDRPASPLRAETAAMARLSAPIVLIALVNMGMSLTDTAMVASLYGAEALAAVAVGSDLCSILFYLGAGTLAGIVPFYTTAVVGGDAGARAGLRRTGLALVLLLAALLVPALWTAPGWLARLGLDPGLLAEGAGYTRAMALTLVPMLGVALYRSILTAAEKPRVFLQVTAGMLPLNGVANWLLMTGTGPLPALGPTGAGVASFLVAAASFGVLAAVAREPGARPAANGRAAPGLLRVLKLGLPIGIATLAELGIFLGATLYAARLGAAEVAAHTVTLRAAGLAYAVPAALLQAAMVRAARAEATGGQRLRPVVARAGLGLALAYGVAVCVALGLGAGPVSGLLFDDSPAGAAAAGLTAGLLVLLGLMELVGAPGSAAAGLLRGRRDTRAPMLCTLAGYWLLGAPLGVWLCDGAGLGITGVWTGLAAGTALSTALLLARLRRPRGGA